MIAITFHVFMRSAITRVLLAATLISAAPLTAQETPPASTANVLKGKPYSPYANRAFPTQVFFGDTHVHTALSADAGGGGTRLEPRDAYRFARGEQINSNTGQPVRLARPFDFFMITDHSDAMGAISDIIKGTPNILADPQGKEFHEAFNLGGQAALDAVRDLIAAFSQGELSSELNYQPGNPAYARVWNDIIDAAEEFNSPGVFTTFIAFEWTSLVKGNNLHRNVIFRDGARRTRDALPFTTTPPIGSTNPRDLWTWLENYEATTGGDVIAIPHNGNLSNGWMFSQRDEFAEDTPVLDAAYAKARARWEPLYEATQMKGDGETHPMLSPEDEFANFETWDFGNLDVSEAKTPEMLPAEYAREALKHGLKLEAELGMNPFKFGMVGASDTHTGLSTPDQDNFYGKFPSYEPNEARAEHVGKPYADGTPAYYTWQYITGGVTAVWAEENTREAIFDGMKRREAYATTGPRMSVRFFGGEFAPEDARGRDLARIGYAKGVPMGGDLRAPRDGQAPSFLVYALRDPIGANLDRIQIVKGWVDVQTGELAEKVYDVAWSGARAMDEAGKLPSVGNSVDLSVPSWTNDIGASELGIVWSDPDFDPAEHAFYYARVIEIPTPRWTAYDAVKFGLEFPAEVPLVTQERAYTSPIWYMPEG
ncbi:MAG: DUF3604 domain-containing protein [Mangrovicoccus sp.]|nr:DUF3604 domain-containing protein [Mangrovicoccus sp.]